MKFSKEWPNEIGYVWFIDLAYREPVVGYLDGLGRLHRDRLRYNKGDRATERFIRFGDMIPKPDYKDIEVEE